jgi:hypothetical protein
LLSNGQALSVPSASLSNRDGAWLKSDAAVETEAELESRLFDVLAVSCLLFPRKEVLFAPL